MIRDPKIEEARETVMAYPRNEGEDPNSRFITAQAMVHAGLTDKEIMDRMPGMERSTLGVYRMIDKLPIKPVPKPVSRADITFEQRYTDTGDVIFRLLDKGLTKAEVRRKLRCSFDVIDYWYGKWAHARGVVRGRPRERK